jgi:hypothetical protein
VSRETLAVATGVLWLALGFVQLAGPTYWSPDSPFDYASVVLMSAAMIALGLCLLEVGDELDGLVLITARVVAISAIVNGVGNFLEDGLGIREFGLLWVITVVLLTLTLPALALQLVTQPRSRALAAAAGLTLVGLLLLSVGGPFVIGICWLAVGLFFREALHPRRSAVQLKASSVT